MIGDIEKVFLNILANEDDRYYLGLLWFDDPFHTRGLMAEGGAAKINTKDEYRCHEMTVTW